MVTKTGVNQDRDKAAGNTRTEEMSTGFEDEGETRIEERKAICSGATLMATHAYTRNPESPLGKILIYSNGKHSSSRDYTQRMSTRGL